MIGTFMQRDAFDERGGVLVIYYWPGGELRVHVRFPKTKNPQDAGSLAASVRPAC